MKRQYQDIHTAPAGERSFETPAKSRRCSSVDTRRPCSSASSASHHNFDLHRGRLEHKCIPITLGGRRCCPESLMDLAAKICAANTPFQYVEERCVRVPQPVMQKFILWSFPRQESDIRRYSALSCESKIAAAQPGPNSTQRQPSDVTTNQQPPAIGSRNVEFENRNAEDEMLSLNSFGAVTSSELEGMEIAFEQGAAMAETGQVKEPLQIGFHLSGLVANNEVDAPANNPGTTDARPSYHVAIHFDRCKITSASCDCGSGNIFFCRHVVALSIFRIRKPHLVTIRLPISETLQQMDRDQLQKLTQYLLAHHNRVLPAAQRVADMLVDPKSDLNAVRGAPDPTAGAGFIDEDRWSLEDREASQHVSALLQSTEKQQSAMQLQSLLAKVREMLRARDRNGARLLTLITEELMSHCSGHSHTNTPHSISGPPDICRMMWDQLGLLWVCVVLNPKISSEQRTTYVEKLQHWRSQPHCPKESLESGSQHTQPNESGRTVLSRAVDAGTMTWDDAHLRRILENCPPPAQTRGQASEKSDTSLYDVEGRPLWHEYVPTACARVEALRSHGCEKEAVALASAVARTIRQKWTDSFNTHQNAEGAPLEEKVIPPLCQGLIGHPLNPIHILFDTLSSTGSNNENPDAHRGNETRDLAFEVTLLTLGQQRTIPEGSHNQEKIVASEAALLRRLGQLQLDSDAVEILKNVCRTLIEGGPTSGLGHPLKRESLPLHNFANYLFQALLPHDRKLAFKVGIRSMQVPVFHRPEPNFYAEAYNPHLAFMRPPEIHQQGQPATRCYIADKLEGSQCQLASSLLQTAKGEVMLLREVVESVQRNICNPTHIFQLSHDAYKAATPPLGSQDSSMLNVSLQMGMQVLRMTIHGGAWRRTEMVGWLVTCATEIGLCALISIIKSWYTLFTPVEATTMVANCVVSPNTAMRLSLDPRQRDELFHCVCQMAIQCAAKDPQSCALSCLTLCENLPSAFDAAYHVVIDSSNKRRMDAAHLYNVARYLEQRGLRQQAFAIAFAATRCLTIAFNHDAHPATSDLLWSVQLSQAMGRNELTQMISVITANVKCASVLSDVLRTCTSGINSRDTTNFAHFGERSLRADGPILRPLLEVAIAAYETTIHSKLSHISPRHYTEFIDFLNKARETYLLSANGHVRFGNLKNNLKMVYKGKKKLLNLVALRFG